MFPRQNRHIEQIHEEVDKIAQSRDFDYKNKLPNVQRIAFAYKNELTKCFPTVLNKTEPQLVNNSANKDKGSDRKRDEKDKSKRLEKAELKRSKDDSSKHIKDGDKFMSSKPRANA